MLPAGIPVKSNWRTPRARVVTPLLPMVLVVQTPAEVWSIGKKFSVDDILGFVHAKDLLTISAAARERPLPLGRVRRMLVLGESTSLDDALLAMQQARIHVAVVTDADGATRGIATLEDVIEALVGDIRDESDR